MDGLTARRKTSICRLLDLGLTICELRKKGRGGSQNELNFFHVLSCSLLLQTIPSAMFYKVWNLPMLFAPGIKLSVFFSRFSFDFSLRRLRTGQRVELLSGRWCNSLQPRIGQLSYPARVGRVSWEVSLRRAKRAHRGLQQVGCILISFYSSLQLLEVFNV